MTLVLQHTVETLRVKATGMLISWSAVASLNFRQVSYVHLHFPHWLVGLIKKKRTHIMCKILKTYFK